MGRLDPELMERVERFGDRMLDVVDLLERKRVRARVLDQMTGCGTSVGANFFEADEAQSRAEFCKCLGISAKELSECRYWIRLVGRRDWIRASRLKELEAESRTLSRIIGAMIVRSKRTAAGRPVR